MLNNVYELYLFVLVCRHRGISNALRAIPWSMDRSSLSRTMDGLTRSMGVGPLFTSKPFRMTNRGAALYGTTAPMFDQLRTIIESFGDTGWAPLRIGAAHVIHNVYMADILYMLRKQWPKSRSWLRNGSDSQLHELLRAGEVDLIIAPASREHTKDIRRTNLVSVPITLIVRDDHPLRDAKELWARGNITEAMVLCDHAEALVRSFNTGLHRLGVKWEPTVVADNLLGITSQVTDGNCIGVTMAIPPCISAPGIRAVPLTNFAPIEISAYYSRNANALVKMLADVLRMRATDALRRQVAAVRRNEGEGENGSDGDSESDRDRNRVLSTDEGDKDLAAGRARKRVTVLRVGRKETGRR